MQPNRYIFKSVSKIIIVILLAILLFIVGLMIGFGVVGDGVPMGVFDLQLWQRIKDFVF